MGSPSKVRPRHGPGSIPLGPTTSRCLAASSSAAWRLGQYPNHSRASSQAGYLTLFGRQPGQLERVVLRRRTTNREAAIINAARDGRKYVPTKSQKPLVSLSEVCTAPFASTHAIEIPVSPGVCQLAWYSWTRRVVPSGHWYLSTNEGLWNGAVAAAAKASRAAATATMSTWTERGIVMSLLVRTRADGTAEPPIAQPRSHSTFAIAHWAKNTPGLSPVSPGRPGAGVGPLSENRGDP